MSAQNTRPPKRIIICCDGTWQSSNHGLHEIPSNIAKISHCLSHLFVNEYEQHVPQVIYYSAGVGKKITGLAKRLGGGLGLGLDKDVYEAYNFIVSNYCSGDELFFFGFSRGAYTVRAVVGLICRVGICEPQRMSQFWQMFAVYKTLNPDQGLSDHKWGRPSLVDPPEKFKVTVKGKSTPVDKGSGSDGSDWFRHSTTNIKIKIVGVWDTVGSLGIPDN
ncbi:DUF2235 domain protein [Metarhizium robertsii]|uniref:T6SS Phospholipase effector Tle1-like catalytic domain-containing protein n=2 Tax=Metarhizium robertsii TaxID=568076 RepID=E9FE71_METRA|nr:uncharacterized protein MAA_10570 [Metarhizium robertsii ARSEF 23]EFY93969.1 hypothetical protein MAA_10570 [Metarhizium robertsii ARSEF 23]EXU94465.1 DUF2235 domain protein [Metarhizium robertsii]